MDELEPRSGVAGATLRGLLIVVNYNQAVEIGNVLRRIEQVFPKADTVVVDDGSSDGSGDLAEQLGFRVLRHPHNRGVGAAVRTGIAHGRAHGYDYICLSSSNGKVLPEEIPRVIEPVVAGRADYTTGSRFIAGGSSPGLTPFRRFAIPVFSLFGSAIIGRRFTDITCGFRAYKLSLFDDPAIDIEQAWLDRYEMEYYIHYQAAQKRDLQIVEVPVEIRYSHLQKGRFSHIRPLVGWWSMIRPLVFLRLGIRS
jgi:dolichol-phosphate mannosyltransferase